MHSASPKLTILSAYKSDLFTWKFDEKAPFNYEKGVHNFKAKITICNDLLEELGYRKKLMHGYTSVAILLMFALIVRNLISIFTAHHSSSYHGHVYGSYIGFVLAAAIFISILMTRYVLMYSHLQIDKVCDKFKSEGWTLSHFEISSRQPQILIYHSSLEITFPPEQTALVVG
jgi:hypothetical protein